MSFTAMLAVLGLAFVAFIWSVLRLRRQQPECVGFSLGEFIFRVVLAVSLLVLLTR